ncbi:MAG: UV DNA damage repair endonuclease UvsE [Desulfurivibrionaceae bacterium]
MTVRKKAARLRFGLCCIFRKEPIRFRQVTARTLRQLRRTEQLTRLSGICLDNVFNLRQALEFAADHGIGAFRILSPLFPRFTHPEVGYRLEELPDRDMIAALCAEIRSFRAKHDLRLSFHPDQFNVLASPRPEVVKNTVRELCYQGMLAELLGAEVINIHVGGAYGDKEEALVRLAANLEGLPGEVLKRLTLENDDNSFTPADLLPVCEKLAIPMVYDVHHHRCLPDGLSIEEATERTAALWRKLGRETYFHISSPRNGWLDGSPKPHADYIDPGDFPSCWLELNATIDVEAKAKELAVISLRQDLGLA